MKKDGITFQELRRFLTDLGFQEKSPKRFEYPSTKTILLFRDYALGELVSNRDMLVVRRQLLDNALIEPSAFENFVGKVSA
jgi:hypothetical protein